MLRVTKNTLRYTLGISRRSPTDKKMNPTAEDTSSQSQTSFGDFWELLPSSMGWLWIHKTRDGRILDESCEGFKSRFDCIKDARKHGMA